MSEIDKTANQVIYLLHELPNPRDAACALAIVHAKLCIQSGDILTNEQQVRAMLADSEKAVLEAWSMFTGIPLSQ